MKCLKIFLIKEVYKDGKILYFENIENFLNMNCKMNNTVVFIFENTIHLNEFIQLCILYGSENIKIIAHNKIHTYKNTINKKYKIKDFIISIDYDKKDCFIQTYVTLSNKGKKILLNLKDIAYIESYYGRIYFHTYFSRCYDDRNISFNKYDTILQDFNFIRIRKGCYVNRMHIKDIKNEIIILSNNLMLFFSKNMHQKYIQEN